MPQISIPKVGLTRLLKEGTRTFQGVEESVLRNIEACSELANTVRSAFGPDGMNKMIINHLHKLFVTNDAATIIKELQVEHPAAKILVMASQMQEQEIGDGTNTVILLAAALLENAEELIRMGLNPTEVSEGYEKACKKALEILPELVCGSIKDVSNIDEVVKGIRPAIMSKQRGYEDLLSKLVAEACVKVLPKEPLLFNIDDVRVCKILGGGVSSSFLMNGMVFTKGIEGAVRKVDKANIAIFSCPFDITQLETKGTVLLHTANELMSYSKGEEEVVEKLVKSLADAGINAVVSGGKFGDMHLHFLNKYNMISVKIQSKFDLRRLCRTVKATALTKLAVPKSEEIGHCDYIYADIVGETEVTVFKQESSSSHVTTVVIRGSSDNVMDDVERAVDNGVNAFKTLTKDGRLLPGAGAVEVELARRVDSYGEVCPGLDQYAIKKFALALETLPKQLADNSGARSTIILSKLYAEHQQNKPHIGFDSESDEGGVKDAVAAGIFDLYLAKVGAIRLAANAACTVLKVDQIIMAKQSAGPKPRPTGGMDQDD